jgi:DNA-binding TFAR19-related protein (PDSD5 family)
MADFELDDDFDFGFTTVGEEVFTEAEAAVQQGQQKAEQIYKLILPLLNNLAKDADKNVYIHWPDRAKKIEQFKKKLNSILNG